MFTNDNKIFIILEISLAHIVSKTPWTKNLLLIKENSVVAKLYLKIGRLYQNINYHRWVSKKIQV